MNHSNTNQTGIHDPQLQHYAKVLVEGGLAANAANNIATGKTLTTPASRAAHMAGNAVIGWYFGKWIAIPYMIISGLIFGSPVILWLAVINNHYSCSYGTCGHYGSMGTGGWIIFAICFVLWAYFAMWKFFIKKIVNPMDKMLAAPLNAAPPRQPAVPEQPLYVETRATIEEPRPARKRHVNSTNSHYVNSTNWFGYD